MYRRVEVSLRKLSNNGGLLISTPRSASQLLANQTTRSKSVFLEEAASSTGKQGSRSDEEVKPFKEIPGPKLWPIIGSLPDYIAKDLQKIQYHKVWQRRYEEYGRDSKIVAERIFNMQWVNVYSPDATRQVFAQEGKYPKRPLLTFYHIRKECMGYAGVVLEDGARWKKDKSLWNRKILRPQAVEDFIPRINDVTDDFIERINQSAGVSDAGSDQVQDRQLMPREVPNLLMELTKYSLEMMGAVALSTRLDAMRPGLDLSLDAHRFIDENKSMWTKSYSLDNSTFQTYRYLPNKTYKAMKDNWMNMTAITSKLMDQYSERMKDTLESEDLSDSTAPDLYSYFLTKDLPDNELLSHMQDILQASLDTTPNTLQMLLYCLAKNPRAQEKLYEEVEGVLQGGEVTVEKLQRLRYLKCCAKESSRLIMTVPGTARILDHDIVINGYNVPKGTFINLCIQSMCHNEDIFDKPFDFIPERWLDVRKTSDVAFSHLPFGFGTRSCIGRRLAEQEIYIFVANLVSRFRMENLCTKEPELKWTGINLTASEPVRLAFHER